MEGYSMKRLLLTGLVVMAMLLPAHVAYSGDAGAGKRAAVLMESMRDPDPNVRRAAAAGLGEMKDKDAVPLLADVLETDEDPEVRLTALGALEIIGDQDAIAAYEKAFRDPDERVRQGAAHALSGFWGESAHKALVNALKDEKSARVRRSVAEALGNPGIMGRYSAHKWDGTEITQAALVEALKNDADYGVRATSARMLGKFKSALSLKALIEAAEKDGNMSVRASSAEALGFIEMPAAVPPLMDIVRFEKDEFLVMSALKALKYYHDPRIPDAARAALESGSARVRWQAIDVLEELRDTGSVEMLTKIAGDDFESEGVRFKAKEALQMMGAD